MLNFNEEIISKAKEAKSVEELLQLAKGNNIELTEDMAKEYFDKLNPKRGELGDEELENVIVFVAMYGMILAKLISF